MANRPLKLDISIGQTKPALTGTARFNAKEVEFGKILSWLKLADDLDVYNDSISFTAELAGNNLKSLLEQSTFALRLNDGYWKLHDPAGKDFKKITFATAAILSKKNSPVSLDFSGDLDGETIQMELSTNKLSAFFTELKKIHMDITANIAKSTINLKGDIDLPISRQSFIIDVDIKGQKLDDWDGLLKSSIPPFGPYRLRGSFRANKKGFRIKNARLKIGNSDLGGQIIINTSDKRTHWALDLVSQTFQINDFKTEDYSLFPGKGKKPGEPGVKPESVLTDQQGSKGRSGITATYPNTSAALNLEARQVLSGKDNLGGGKLHINLTGDSLSVDNFNLNMPGGSVEGALTLQRVEDGLTGILKLNMDKFDYGVLYRYIKPDSTYDGLISTRVNLNLAGYDAMHLLDHANGTIDFVIWPK